MVSLPARAGKAGGKSEPDAPVAGACGVDRDELAGDELAGDGRAADAAAVPGATAATDVPAGAGAGGGGGGAAGAEAETCEAVSGAEGAGLG